MKLKKLLAGIKVLNATEVKNVTINNIANSTTQNLSNGLYVCLKGEKVDGHTLKQEAKRLGAVAFLVEEYDYDFDGMQILVESTRKALSYVAKNFYGGKTPKIIGITGTNGKTTTTHILAHILESNGKKVGLIGTNGAIFNGQTTNFNMTTPDPIELFSILAQMHECKVEYAIMEVSAHAIFYEKTSALTFYAKALTNVAEDHLDFFKDIKLYQQTKLKFMQDGKCIKVVNVDDKQGCKFASKNKNAFTYSLSMPADAMAKNISCSGSFDAVLNGKSVKISSGLVGNYNISNALCAMLIASKLGINGQQIANALKTFNSVNGRLNIFKKEQFYAIVDFAHTAHAMSSVLKAVRHLTSGKIIVVFGCGGNRDAQKRSKMGQIASKLASFVIVTNDNPRYEDSQEIANQITSGIIGNNYQVILDRKMAITKAVSMLSEGDYLLVLGKGCEEYMEINGKKIAFSDSGVLEQLGFVKQN